ncbi:putative monogalactosyldiacylglycerol synthase 3, chloroplastic [Zea mays]|uniref:monogalactosyldiacylglycerol synthase n=1 Tax=Zea mays TaxID=4577 RepID=A0A3L6EKJ1_MAIZE|nr:putative monogalactosyldiacylglycerol synthase 3, chloroplastic [Zea mays]
MAASMASPRGRSIRETVLETVAAYHQQQRAKGKLRKSLTYAGGELSSAGRARGDGPASTSVSSLCGPDDDDEPFWEEEEGTVELVQLGANRAKNVLILMSDTGGGHRASAEAIKDAFRIEFGDEYRVFVKDLCKDHAGWPLNNMESSYKFMVKHVQLWKVAFHSTSPRWVHNFYLAALASFYAKKVEAGLKKYKPDIIISVHPLMQHIPLWVLKWQGLQNRVVFVTVITDLNTCHPTWFHADVNRCYCPSEEDDLRRELELDPELPAVLLMGGGEGMGPVKKTARALGESLFDKELGKPIGQLIVICGRNKTLSSSLQAVEWKIPVKVRGFETQMEKWMGACDCIITKAGPGTIAEALIRGLPIILNDFIPGQEVGNVPYVVDNGAGVFSKSPKETASLVARWFGPDSEELKKMSEKALKLAQPEAVFDIVKDMHELSQEQGVISQISSSLTSSFFLPSPESTPLQLI